MFIVVCRSDQDGDQKGEYLLATRRVFETKEQAENYQRGLSPSREPIVVKGRWFDLRLELSLQCRNGLTIENGVIREDRSRYPFDTCFDCGGAINLEDGVDASLLILCTCGEKRYPANDVGFFYE